MPAYDPLSYPYPSRRSVVYARRGMVATTQPLAAQAGIDMLKKGGNAVDAAVATAACLTVVEPTSNGVGGDAFALVWTGGKLHGLNSSGPAPQLLNAETVRKHGHCVMPHFGWLPVTVPGVPAAWAEMIRRFGRLSLPEVLAPAVSYAEEGYPVSPVIHRLWQRGYDLYRPFTDEVFKHWFEHFAPEGRPPNPGEVWRSPALASTLRSIAETGALSFYQGELAEKIDAFARRSGGLLRAEDLAAFQPEWVEPISTRYRSYDVWEIPPNGHGLVALLALNILEGFDFTAKELAETYHRQIEAVKLAFADGLRYIADPRYMKKTSVTELLSAEYAAERRSLISRMALDPAPGKPSKGGTVYLAAADGEGNMVSFIQSNYWNFGSGIVVPGTGISLHDRGANFSLEEGHENLLEPGKKPYHTIIPGFLSRDGQPVGPFGVMGGFIQPQGHVQMVMNTVDFGLNPQAALDAPRWQWTEGKTIEIEHQFPDSIADELARRGHTIVRTPQNLSMGRGQIIWRENGDVLIGGTEPRADGTIACW